MAFIETQLSKPILVVKAYFGSWHESNTAQIISKGYRENWSGMLLVWEQEIGGSNPLAPTSLRFWTEWKTKAAASKPKAKTGRCLDSESKLKQGITGIGLMWS